MCGQGQSPAPVPANVGEALAMAHAALDFLNRADPAGLGVQGRADCLTGLGRLSAKQAAAQGRMLTAFAAGRGHEADGQYSPRTWLRVFTRVTSGAAGAAVAAARDLAAHPVVAAALAEGDVSPSWARQICGWTSRLPEEHVTAADEILVRAARHGADLAGLAQLIAEIHRHASAPDADRSPAALGPDRFVRLGVTFGGAGKLDGDLTPEATAAVSAVLEALGGKNGPEDTRSVGQRHHDALAEACRRLIASGGVPGRAGGDTRAEVVIGLAGLRALPGAAAIEQDWIAQRAAAAAAGAAVLDGPAAAATACHGTLVPIVTGHLDPHALGQLTATYLSEMGALNGIGALSREQTPAATTATRDSTPATGTGATRDSVTATRDSATGDGGGRPPPARGKPSPTQPGTPEPAQRRKPQDRKPRGRTPHGGEDPLTGLKAELLRWAIETVSGPAGLAARLRTTLLDGPLANPSLPLDIATPGAEVPAHLRRALAARDRHCQFPGCRQPATVCHPHHLIPRSQGGPTAPHNMILLCPFHHLIVIHTWGWHITLHPDGTTTATSPTGKTLHSHSPPTAAA